MELEVAIRALSVISLFFMSSLIIYVIRVLKGPTIPDMVLAIDALAFDLTVFIIVLAIIFNSTYLAIAALPLALWIYILDMYVAKYLTGREVGD